MKSFFTILLLWEQISCSDVLFLSLMASPRLIASKFVSTFNIQYK